MQPDNQGLCCVDGSHAGGEGALDEAHSPCRAPPVRMSVGVRWVPVPARGDPVGGALVPAVRVVLPGPRGAARRAWHRGRPRHRCYRWVQRFTPLLIDAARPCRHAAGDRWFVDETYVKVAGVWRYVYRAVDQHGQVIDVYVSRSARHRRRRAGSSPTALAAHGEPAEVITDRAPALANVIEELLPRRVAQHRPVREQPGRMRPRPAQGQTATDARAEDRPHRERGDPRARLHPEPTPRPLRARSRRRADVSGWPPHSTNSDTAI